MSPELLIDGKTYKDNEINPVLKNGFTLLDNKVKCTLSLDSGWTEIPSKKAKPEKFYGERMWLTCDINSIKTEFDAVSCYQKKKNEGLQIERLGFLVEGKNITISCSGND